MTKKNIREACRLANEEGDQTLCERENCPWYGDPNGCNHPTGYRDEAPYGNAAAMRNALLEIQELAAGMTSKEDEENALAILDECAAALAEPARNCDRFRSSKDVEDHWRDNCASDIADSGHVVVAWLMGTEEKHD